MPFILTMPKLSPTMEGGTIVKWYKKEQDLVKEGDVLFEVATDKATVEYSALDGGYLRKILTHEKKDALVNDPVAIFAETLTESIDEFIPKPAEKKAEAKAPINAFEKKEISNQSKVLSLEPEFVQEEPLQDYEFEYPTGMSSDSAFASPLAKKIAKEKNIDLTLVKGTGPSHRITSEDLEGIQGAEVPFHARSLPQDSPGTYILEPLSPLRKVIGKRLQSSKSFIPHFYVQQVVFADAMVSVREQLKTVGYAITFNDLVIRAVALALRKHPILNAGYNNVENSIIAFKTIDIAVAVSVAGGIITPIIRHTDYKNVCQISSEVKKLVKLAKDSKLKPEQYKGGSFTISNLGMFGIKDFQPIINPPQACILGIGGILDEPVVRNNQVLPGKVLNLSLASDHRVVDGADAAQFLNTLKKYLENPAALLI